MDHFSPERSLKTLSAALESPIESVLDVGVQFGTPFLTAAFPNAVHFLFEPVTQYHAAIESSYRKMGITFSLQKCAVSNTEGHFFQHNLANAENPEHITHSQLLDAPCPQQFGGGLHSITQVSAVTLDKWASTTAVPKPYLLKIDVDGLEDEIINGGRDTVSGASVIVVETTMSSLSKRLTSLEHYNFVLFDIVGQGYYFDQLHQVDLIMVSQSLREANPRLRPWDSTQGKVDWSRWQQLA